MTEVVVANHDTADVGEEVITLLQKLVQHDSADPPGREIDIARFVSDYLSQRGIECVLDEFLPGRANVLARIPGKQRNGGLVFSSHLDTVSAGTQAWRVPPLSATIDGSRMYGRGVSNMKSALAAMMVMATDLDRSGHTLPHDVVQAFSAGESSNCLGSKRFMAQDALAGAAAVVVGEPSSLDFIVAHIGVVWVRVTARGRMGHVSGASGKSAINLIMGVIEQLAKVSIPASPHAYCGAPSINVGTIQGGSAVNVTPDLCSIEVDVRVPPGTDLSVVEEAM
jgi:succinyl-diaminopimelate desuccinylase